MNEPSGYALTSINLFDSKENKHNFIEERVVLKSLVVI